VAELRGYHVVTRDRRVLGTGEEASKLTQHGDADQPYRSADERPCDNEHDLGIASSVAAPRQDCSPSSPSLSGTDPETQATPLGDLQSEDDRLLELAAARKRLLREGRG